MKQLIRRKEIQCITLIISRLRQTIKSGIDGSILIGRGGSNGPDFASKPLMSEEEIHFDVLAMKVMELVVLCWRQLERFNQNIFQVGPQRR